MHFQPNYLSGILLDNLLLEFRVKGYHSVPVVYHADCCALELPVSLFCCVPAACMTPMDDQSTSMVDQTLVVSLIYSSALVVEKGLFSSVSSVFNEFSPFSPMLLSLSPSFSQKLSSAHQVRR